jgi:hypothetical protein
MAYKISYAAVPREEGNLVSLGQSFAKTIPSRIELFAGVKGLNMVSIKRERERPETKRFGSSQEPIKLFGFHRMSEPPAHGWRSLEDRTLYSYESSVFDLQPITDAPVSTAVVGALGERAATVKEANKEAKKRKTVAEEPRAELPATKQVKARSKEPKAPKSPRKAAKPRKVSKVKEDVGLADMDEAEEK